MVFNRIFWIFERSERIGNVKFQLLNPLAFILEDLMSVICSLFRKATKKYICIKYQLKCYNILIK